MPKDDRNTLEVLKAELNFVEKGGYGRSPREPWRATLALEDSPTCMNYDTKEHRTPCAECLLMQFVPADNRTGDRRSLGHMAQESDRQAGERAGYGLSSDITTNAALSFLEKGGQQWF
jgi:hypothetical protein